MNKRVVKKITFTILKNLLIALCIPMAFVIRLLRPFVTIRFGRLMVSRIGHFSLDTEVYLCERDAGLHGKRIYDIFYYTYRDKFSNYQLKKMWDRVLPVSRLASLVDKSNRLLPASNKHILAWGKAGYRDIHNLLIRTSSHLSFTSQEERLGKDALGKLGIASGESFVCIYARDTAYLDTTHSQYERSQWSYHDYRDFNVKNYLSAAENLTQRGYYVIRMGSVVKEAFKTTNPRIIDYSTNGARTDFLDIYLAAKCEFFLGATAGFTCIPMVFRRPVGYVNQIPLEYVSTWSSDYITIFKKLWLRKEGRFLTFEEIINLGAGRFVLSQQYDQLGVDVIENTPEEIEGLAIEMDQRSKGAWAITDEDEYLQKRFWSIFPKKDDWHGQLLGRIGTHFLRNNKDLLGLNNKVEAGLNKKEL